MKQKKYIAAMVAVVCSMAVLGYVVVKKRPAAHPVAAAAVLVAPRPTEGEENEELREKYQELRHRTAPGTDWEAVEAANAKATYQNLATQTGNIAARVTETFAGGAISGDWSERGAANQTGNVRSVDYVPATNILYTISNGGSLWRSILGSGSWALLNQGYRLEQRTIQAFTKTGGGTRILAAAGTTLMYSDNEGSTFTAATGISFPVAWGGNFVAKIIRLADGSNTIYCLTRPWSASPWGPRYWLYRSTNQGQSFTKIYEFSTGDDDRISICNPYNTTSLFVADVNTISGSVALYNVSGITLTTAGTYSIGITNPTCVLKGTYTGSILTLYLLVNNHFIYRSTNTGATWELRSTLTEDAWNKMNVSINNANAVSYGGVNAYRSSDGAATFTKVNEWSEYYGNVSGKLHADIMEIEYFAKADNTEFAIIDTHGGTYVSYNNLTTVANQSLSSHYATEYYDVLTDTLNSNRIFVGTQDQGLQRTLTGTTAGVQPFQQVISGDYGQLSLTANNQFLWPQYPGGVYYLYNNLGNAGGPSYIGQWSMSGTQMPNYGWMLAATSTANAAANQIWIGGGNINGGGGSYLSKLTMATTSPYIVTPTQLAYDFRANSNNGTSGITAIEQSLLNPNRLFVATEDGTFFYSADLGTTWTKSTAFSGPTPWYLYGSCILASRKNADVVWYAGSGYSNPAVYKSVNGGVSFTAMNNGLPPTLVNEIVATSGEDFLFAATEAGPYVYITAANQWYPLTGVTTPVQFFSSVEYIAAEKTVRFGTMGRGIWDFKITSVLPVSLLRFAATSQNDKAMLGWTTSTESNSSHFTVERSYDGRNFSAIGTVAAAGLSITSRNYSLTDPALLSAQRLAATGNTVYYRLQMVDKDGTSKTSTVASIRLSNVKSNLVLLQNPVQSEALLQYQGTVTEKITLQVSDASGKIILQRNESAVAGTNQYHIATAALAKGIYTVLLVNSSAEKLIVRMVKE